MEAESPEKKIEEDSQEELKEHPGERDKEADNEESEIPLEKMTKRQLLNRVKEVQKTADKNFDLYVRSQAEIDNLKKRFQRDKAELYKFSNESLIKNLLSVGDNLEKAIAHSENDNSLDALREGVELTLKGLMDTLEREGLESVKALDEPFDPNFHEAVSELKDNSVKPGTVIQELQKGYILNQRLIRPAMVIVSKKDE
ncbi:MAG: nucleotide exchange factor GrpE [Desulfobacteraceae bacterium 4484_190.2]|nr:MAG: nucleotide exchange factor GrpE [Desulfobacteraceae bacterium 4484_190.2]